MLIRKTTNSRKTKNIYAIIKKYVHMKDIVQQYKEGKTIKQLAKENNISYSTMRNRLMMRLTCEEWTHYKKRNMKYNLEKQINQSKIQNTTGYFRVNKNKCPTCKQGFSYAYQYYNEKGEKKRITKTDIKKLEQAVKEKGLPWIKIE